MTSIKIEIKIYFISIHIKTYNNILMSTVEYEPKLTDLYLESLSVKEKKGYLIAKSHLGMSFDLEKSVGFLRWKNKYLEKNTE